jgi:hypothetical protein
MDVIRTSGFWVDQYFGICAFERLYKDHMFRTNTVSGQDDSLFMGLPPEIRLMIYDLVLSSPKLRGGAHYLFILLVGRQIHREAIVKALQTTKFHVPRQPFLGLDFDYRLRGLGPLRQQLRHVHVDMNINLLDADSPTNPFVLTELPLDTLDIDFGCMDDPNEGWLHQNRMYHTLLSAMLYQTTSKHRDGSTISLHQSLVERTKRSLATTLMQK